MRIHAVDALQMGVRISLSVRVEDCGPDCYVDAKLLAEKLESNRLSNETFFNAEHPITCSCSHIIWEGMSVASGVVGCRSCATCDAGKYQDVPFAEYCKLCPAGTYSPYEGNTHLSNCTLCIPGQSWVSPEMPRLQRPCVCICVRFRSVHTVWDLKNAGKYADTEANTAESDCQLCSAGKYSTVRGSVSNVTCTDCVAGKYLSSPGNDQESDCQLCSAG